MLPLINRNLFLIPVQHNPESPALSVAAEPHAGTLPLAICLERYIHGKGKILYDFLGENAAESSAVALQSFQDIRPASIQKLGELRQAGPLLRPGCPEGSSLSLQKEKIGILTVQLYPAVRTGREHQVGKHHRATAAKHLNLRGIRQHLQLQLAFFQLHRRGMDSGNPGKTVDTGMGAIHIQALPGKVIPDGKPLPSAVNKAKLRPALPVLRPQPAPEGKSARVQRRFPALAGG